jgi:ABC-type nitrate/sulfonate/bicarbonate transport system substrate-binding protein
MTTGFDRRMFLRRGLGMTAVAAILDVGGGSLLAACGNNSGSGAPADGSKYGVLDFRFSWIKNAEFGGYYLADQRGYYKDAGFSGVNFIAGGASATPQETDVVTGKAFVGTSSPDVTASAILQGAPIKIIGAQYPKNLFAIMSMADKPIKDPQAMVGKKIGVQATNETVWAAFLKANNLDPKSITKIPVQFDPLPLTTGQVDGWFSFITNEPSLLKVKGFDTYSFLLSDYKYPSVSESYMVRTESIDNDRDKIKAMLTANIRGWKDNLADPKLGAHLAVTVYGKDLGLDEAEQTLESTAENKLILDADTKKNGLFTITDELVAETVATLQLGGVDIAADKLFDLSIIRELYQEKPELI